MAKKLTPEEELEAQEFVDIELIDDKAWIEKLHKSKDHKRTAQELRDLEKFQRKVERGEIKSRRRGDDGYEESVATMEEIQQVTDRLDRPWDEEWIIGFLAGTYSPLSKRKYSDAFGVEDAN